MIKRILSTTLVLLALAVVLGFASAEMENRRVEVMDIQIKDAQKAAFLDAQRIHAELGSSQYEGQPLHDVDLQGILDLLLDLPACDHAEVYSKMNGTVHIDLWQRHPVMRVHTPDGEDYYLDETGRRMALDKYYTPHIPVMHVARESQANMGYRFVKATQNDPFWNALTDQLSMNESGELILHPRLAGHEIVLGNASNSEHKKRNLIAFYRAHVKRGNLRNFKRIDLTYSDQVIAQRYP